LGLRLHGTGTASSSFAVSFKSASAASLLPLSGDEEQAPLRHYVSQMLAVPLPEGISRYVVLAESTGHGWIIGRQMAGKDSDTEIFGQAQQQAKKIDVADILTEIAAQIIAQNGEREPAYTTSPAANISESAPSKVVSNVRFVERRMAGGESAACELSVVMPCLNEADTLATCIQKAQLAFREHQIDGEIVIADNGSTDGSIDIAQGLGARVVRVAEKGYGRALMEGISASRGRFIIMGDADDSYDFTEIPRFLTKLREGNDLVQGCRLPSGEGKIKPGAMPFLHRWLGNPMFSFLVQKMFQAPINDVYCGFRGFTKELFEKLEQQCVGMEFATEMIVRSSLCGKKIAEVPITLYPDGRKAHGPHLRTFRDGWRTLRFFMLYSPRWLYLVPGVALMLCGGLGFMLALPGYTVFGAKLDAHTLLFSSLFVLLGYQAVLFAVLTKVFAISERLLPDDPRLNQFFKVFSLELGLFCGGFSFVSGLALLSATIFHWWKIGFGSLDYARTMRCVIPGMTLAALGFQTILFSFFTSILGMRRK
jgi:glycosyltransferase involved in cell wall biosynthesis